MSKSGYNPKIVSAYFLECGLPEPEFEVRFHPERRWRFDIAWPRILMDDCDGEFYEYSDGGIAIEVQGGIFVQGRHNRGAALVKEHEKLNEAAAMGWRVLFIQPRDLCTDDTVLLVRRCLGWQEPATKGADPIAYQTQT